MVREQGESRLKSRGGGWSVEMEVPFLNTVEGRKAGIHSTPDILCSCVSIRPRTGYRIFKTLCKIET